MKTKADDRRKHERKNVVLTATLFDGECQLLTSCVVRDASESGCMLIGANAQTWPREIILSFRDYNCTRKGRIVWRNSKAAGVEFT